MQKKSIEMLLADIEQIAKNLLTIVEEEKKNLAVEAPQESEALVEVTPEVVEEAPKHVIDLETLRDYLTEMARDGMTADVKQLLQRYDADKLSKLNPSHYEAVYLEAEEIRNAKRAQ